MLTSPEAQAGALLYKKGSFTKTNAVATQAITGVGFQPKAIIFSWTKQTATGTAVDVSAGYGVTTGAAASRAIAVTVQNGISPANSRRRQSQTDCIVILDVASVPPLRARASLSSFDPDGFTLNWTSNNTPAAIIHYVAIGGPEITNALAGSFTPTAAVGAQAVGTVGFQPDFLMFLSIDSATLDTNLNNADPSLGFAAGPNGSISQAGIVAQLIPDGLTSGANGQQRTDSALLQLLPAGGAVQQKLASVQSFDAAGFTINKTVAVDATPVHFLALRGGVYEVGAFDKTITAAPPAVDQAVTGVGFEPTGLILASRDKGAFAGITSEAFLHLGAADSTSQGATSIHNNNCCTNSAERTSTTAAATFIDTAGLLAEARRKSFDPDGFTLTWTTQTDGSAREVLYVAFGPAPTVVSYSVGTSTANLRSSPALTMSIASGIATLSESQATNVGIGDKITYNGGTVAYVKKRHSSTSYTLITGVGTPAPNVVGATVDSIMRAFNTLTAANAGSADASHLNLAGPPYDLVAANVQLHWPCYNDGPLNDAPTVTNWTTGPANYIRIFAPYGLREEVGAVQRHSGIEGTGFRLRAIIASPPQNQALLTIDEEYVRVEGIELDGSGLTDTLSHRGIYVTGNVTSTSDVRIDGNIIHDIHVTNAAASNWNHGILVGSLTVVPLGVRAKVSNNLVYDITNPFSTFVSHVVGIAFSYASTSYAHNNTVYHVRNTGPAPNGAAFGIQAINSSVAFARNNYVGDVISDNDPTSICYDQRNAGTLTQQTNASSDATGTPAGLRNKNVYANYFVNATVGSENLHLKNTSTVLFTLPGTDLRTNADLPVILDSDREPRHAAPDLGADEFLATTAVELMSFEAAGLDGVAELRWQTASELNNLGFHLYRSTSADGPYTRITSSLIPGLGSSPVGQSYSYRDSGLTNGMTYFYKLEDVDTTGRKEQHGPVSARPGSASGDGEGAGEGGPGGEAGPPGNRYGGDPSAAQLRILERGLDYLVLELLTPGFTAFPQEDGTVRLSVPGFDDTSTLPGAPDVPVRQALVEAVAGRKVRLASFTPKDILAFDSFRVAAADAREVEVTDTGMVKPASSRRSLREAERQAGFAPRRWASLVGTLFQEETKKARLQLSPLRHDPASGRTILARRLTVRLEFSGNEPGERSLGGSRGLLAKKKIPTHTKGVLAQLVVGEPGLYRVRFEDLFGRRRTGVNASTLRLSRLGQAVPYHLEPDQAFFSPGSSLFFLSEGSALNPSGSVVYELSLGQTALRMSVVSAPPSGPSTSEYKKTLTLEQNRFYQAALLGAPDLWLWDLLVSPVTKSYPFTVEALSPSSTPSHLEVVLQGASDFEEMDHHLRLSVNGFPVAETTWDGKTEKVVQAEINPGVLVEGENTLSLENLGDAGAEYSMVLLNRFSVSFPRRLTTPSGRLEGRFASGSSEITGLSSPAMVVDKTRSPIWLKDTETTASGLRFRSEADHDYLAVASTSLLTPQLRKVVPSVLRSNTQRARWIVIGPREFLPAAKPLVDLRRRQGLAPKAIALEDIQDEFGYGESGPQALRDFLSFAFHHWKIPPRYVLLLGDSTYDPKDYLQTGIKDRVPSPLVQTSYLWTVSDSTLAAVNGEDSLPDFAIGRLSAGSLDQATKLVQKLLAFEEAGRTFAGRAVLVADNSDLAGNFEANQDEVAASLLGGHEVQKLYLRDLGAGGLRSEIVSAFDSGPGLLSYVGHGGTAVWASENVFNNMDVASLQTQPQQPLLLTLNCLNGFFHMPTLDSLAEALVKAEGKGAIAAFSPSGLSLNDAARLYHNALVSELESGAHRRIGDALLAAQKAYADQGVFPELLTIYHLFGDPAMKIR